MSFNYIGVLYYEGSAANGVHITDYVQEIKDKASFDKFITGSGPEDHVLKVICAWGGQINLCMGWADQPVHGVGRSICPFVSYTK